MIANGPARPITAAAGKVSATLGARQSASNPIETTATDAMQVARRPNRAATCATVLEASIPQTAITVKWSDATVRLILRSDRITGIVAPIATWNPVRAELKR